MKPEEILAHSEFQKILAGQVPDALQPVSQAEAGALRDRLRSLINMISRTEEHLSQLDSKVQELRARAEDAEEIGKQFKHLAIKVQEMSARLKTVEDKLGVEVPASTEEAPAPKKTPKKKKQ